VILSGNPLDLNSLELRIVETIIGGRTVFTRQ
jgi:hypothetical protein